MAWTLIRKRQLRPSRWDLANMKGKCEKKNVKTLNMNSANVKVKCENPVWFFHIWTFVVFSHLDNLTTHSFTFECLFTFDSTSFKPVHIWLHIIYACSHLIHIIYACSHLTPHHLCLFTFDSTSCMLVHIWLHIIYACHISHLEEMFFTFGGDVLHIWGSRSHILSHLGL